MSRRIYARVAALASAVLLMLGVAAPAGAAELNWPSDSTDYAYWPYGRSQWESVIAPSALQPSGGAYVRVLDNDYLDTICVEAWYWDGFNHYFAPVTCVAGYGALPGKVLASFAPVSWYPVHGRRIQFISNAGYVVRVCDTVWSGLAYC